MNIPFSHILKVLNSMETTFYKMYNFEIPKKKKRTKKIQ